MSSACSELTVSGLEAAPVGRFLDDLASAAPTPGGGAAVGLTGALAAALVAMVCRLTARREPLAPGLLEAASRADELRRRLAHLTTDDAAAYDEVLGARRANDPSAAEAALARATDVPLAVARSAGDVLALVGEVAPAARASALADLGVALALAEAALNGAVITARANLVEMADAARARAAGAEIDGLVAQGQARRHRAAEAIAQRSERPRP